ncbi:MAG: cytochrome c biogenesis protein CcsA [Cocleimonas sp.]
MTATSLSLLATALYFITWLLIMFRVRSQIAGNEPKPKSKSLYLMSWFVALIAHILVLHYPLLIGKALGLNFFSLASYVMWFISLVLFITSLTRRVKSLALLLIPFSVLSILLPLYIEGQPDAFINMKTGLGVHILTSLLAYSLLMLASFQALLLAFQNNQLRTHQSSGFSRNLPSLEDMEHLLFRFISIGLVLLSITLITGFAYLDNLFGSGIAHKTILSIFSWLIFTALLFGRWKYGWRGRKAINWTLVGFSVLVLSFFGTKFVQEFVL